jgi:hypothetical protein
MEQENIQPQEEKKPSNIGSYIWGGLCGMTTYSFAEYGLRRAQVNDCIQRFTDAFPYFAHMKDMPEQQILSELHFIKREIKYGVDAFEMRYNANLFEKAIKKERSHLSKHQWIAASSAVLAGIGTAIAIQHFNKRETPAAQVDSVNIYEPLALAPTRVSER